MYKLDVIYRMLTLNRRFRNTQTFRIDSIGVTPGKFYPVSPDEKAMLREKYGYRPDQFLLIYTAEFITRKNHKFIIDALPQLIKEIPEIKVLFAGTGKILDETMAYARRKNLNDYIDFLGFRQDIGQLISLSDIGISSSRQEGYGMHIAEGMFCGLPFVVTEDRGHREMIIQGVNGYIFPQYDQHKFIEHILFLYNNPDNRHQMGQAAINSIQKCSAENALKSMVEIYRKFI